MLRRFEMLYSDASRREEDRRHLQDGVLLHTGPQPKNIKKASCAGVGQLGSPED